MKRVLGLLALSLVPHCAMATGAQPRDFPAGDYLKPAIDFNGDGFDDIVVLDRGAVRLHTNNGVLPLGFTEAIVSDDWDDVELKDVTGDGQPEIIILGSDAGDLTIYMYDAESENKIRAVPIDVEIPPAEAFALVPVWQPADSEHYWIAWRHASSASVTFYAIDSTGAVHATETVPFDYPTSELLQPKFGDVDGDGDVDYVRCEDATTVALFVNSGGKYVRTQLPDFVDADQTISSATIGNYDGDSLADIFLGGDELAIVVDAAGEAPSSTSTGTGSANFSLLDARDMDNDGDTDYISRTFVRFGDDFYSTYAHGVGSGAGSFSLIDTGSTRQTGFPADVDGDGDLDLMGSSGYHENLQIAPTHRSYGFEDATEGWAFGSVPLQFDVPVHDVAGGGLVMTSSNNTSTFGYWSGSARIDSAVPSEPMGVFRADFEAGSGVADASMVPVVRFRTNDITAEHTETLVITSEGDGGLSPSTAPRTYPLFAKFRSDSEYYGLSFDLLNFDPRDAGLATVTLHSAGIESLAESPLSGLGEEVLLLDFADDAHGWTPRTAEPALVAPEFFGVGPGGLAIQGAPDTEGLTQVPIFGYWGAETSVPFEASTLYRVTWRVETNASDATKKSVAAFRLRVNDSSFKFGQYSNIESLENDASPVPTMGNPRDFEQYILTPAEIAGQTWNFAFDYLLVPPPATDNDPTISIVLKSLKVEKFATRE